MKTLFSLAVSSVIVAIVAGIVLATAPQAKANGRRFAVRTCAPVSVGYSVGYAAPVLAAPVCDCEPVAVQSYATFAAPVYSSFRSVSYPRFASRAFVDNRVFVARQAFVPRRAVFLGGGGSLLNLNVGVGRPIVNLGGRRGLVNFGGVGRRGGLNLRLR